MKHLGTEVRQLGGLGKRKVRNETGVLDDARVGAQHPVDVGPDLNF